MNADKKAEEDRISMITISRQLKKLLDGVAIITQEIAELKEREGGEHGDN